MILFDRKHFRGHVRHEKHIRGHGRWFVVFLVLLLGSSAGYWYYARTAPNGPTGGSWPGLAFGIAGSLCMLFAGAFNQRKKFPRWTWLGDAQFWMRGHVWLGTLSLPLIFFHSGLRFGGLVETVLMIVLLVVWLSGVFGLLMQQYLPKTLLTNVSAEAMYQQVDEVCRQLRLTAEEKMSKLCGDLFEPQAKTPAMTPLKRFYVKEIHPFLQPVPPKSSRLSNAAEADAVFDAVRNLVSDKLHADLDWLKRTCDERRDLEAQKTIHGWLHKWLFIHVPLSMTLLVMGVIHVVSALWY